MDKSISNQEDLRLGFHSSGYSSTLGARQRAWLEVSPDAIESNTRILKDLIDKSCSLMAVVKADGYGHGAVTVARAALRGGAEKLGVATLQEGLELRQAGLDCPILVLGNLIRSEELAACLEWDLMPTLSTMRQVDLCQNLAKKLNKIFNVQLKVDTGMRRLGCEYKEASSLISAIASFSNLCLKGLYSHLALADEDLDEQTTQITRLQKQLFEELISSLSLERESICCHLANSAGTLRDSGLHFDMVRVGLSIYGYNPLCEYPLDLGLQPALSVKARVTLLRDVPSGVGVSYGHSFITKRKTRLAIVGIGYADGVNRALSGKISALINGHYLPQVGSITMDQLVLDATDYPELEAGSIVTLLGPDGNDCLALKEWSDLSGSIPWEVLCGFKHRLPRLVV